MSSSLSSAASSFVAASAQLRTASRSAPYFLVNRPSAANLSCTAANRCGSSSIEVAYAASSPTSVLGLVPESSHPLRQWLEATVEPPQVIQHGSGLAEQPDYPGAVDSVVAGQQRPGLFCAGAQGVGVRQPVGVGGKGGVLPRRRGDRGDLFETEAQEIGTLRSLPSGSGELTERSLDLPPPLIRREIGGSRLAYRRSGEPVERLALPGRAPE